MAWGVLLYLVPLLFPLPDNIEGSPEKSLVFTDRNGVPLRRFLTEDGLKADRFIRLDEVPRHLINATVAVEDQRFFRHHGVDFIGICRAIRDSAARRKFVSGASTITQQLIKISSPARSRTFDTKLLEIAKARKLEFTLEKPQIMAAYLNRLPYGNQLTGCRIAARRYFAKPVSDLSLAESAFLAGLPNRPSYLNPYRNFPAAKKRQLWVLKRMLDEKYISYEEYSIARRDALVLNTNRNDEFRAPHFVDLYFRHHPEKQDQVTTTLDLELQTRVEEIVDRQLNELTATQFTGENSKLHAAVVVIDNPTGEILALTGSRDFFSSESGQINGAWEPRSAGSTLKPFTYMLGLEKGFTAASIIPDIPTEYVSEAGAYQPVNFDRRCNGPVSIRRALATSLNIPAVRLLKQVGGPRQLHYVMQQDLGFTSLQGNGDSYGLGLTIGNAEVRLLELTNAYACLARLGKWKPYRFTVQGTVEDRTLYSREDAWILADILSDNEARAPAFGYHSPLRLPFRAAAKTGTSTDFRDSWTVGFTPEFTVGVWLGRFDNRPLPDELTGALGAGPIFHEVLAHLHEKTEPSWYPKPEGIITRQVDQLNGLLVNRELPATPAKTREEFFREGNLPATASGDLYNAKGQNLLPVEYSAWWDSPGNVIQKFAALDIDQMPDGFEITSPRNGTTAYIDPDLPSGGRRFPLRVEGSVDPKIEWICETLQIEKTGGRNWLILQPGTHLVKARDEATGEHKVTKIKVESL